MIAASELDMKSAEARELVRESLALGGKACITCSFQTEDMIAVALVREFRPDIPVLFLDTGYHFEQVYRYRDELQAQLGLNLINIKPEQTIVEQEAAFGLLHQARPDECCRLRKVGPLFAALEDYSVWFTGLRRVQSPTRANLQPAAPFELPTGKELLKISPLVSWSDDEVWFYARQLGLPVLSLYEEGFTSIGCEPCTSKPSSGDLRSGRWAGRKLECGIHIAGRH